MQLFWVARRLLQALSVSLMFSISPSTGEAQNNEVQNAQFLYLAGDLDLALKVASRHPDDAHALFLTSLILREEGPLQSPKRAFDAAFRATQDYDYAPARYLLGEYYAAGFGTPANGTYARSNKNLALMEGYDPGPSPLHFMTLDPAAAKSYVAAVEMMSARTPRRDHERINRTLEEAGALGHTEALRKLASRLLKGSGGFQDGARAMRLIASIDPENEAAISAAIAGDADAQYRLGRAFYPLTDDTNLRFPRDMDTALTWYGRAASQGHAEGLSDYAWITLAKASPGGGSVGVIATDDRSVLNKTHGILTLAASQGSVTASARLARVETLLKRRADRDRNMAIAIGALALVVYIASQAPGDPVSQVPAPRDPCAGMNGLGWIDESLGNAAAIFGGCSPY